MFPFCIVIEHPHADLLFFTLPHFPGFYFSYLTHLFPKKLYKYGFMVLSYLTSDDLTFCLPHS